MKRYFGLALGLAVLAAGIVFVVYETAKDKREGKRQEFSIVFPFGAAKVNQLSVALEGKEAVFRRGASAWELVSGPEGADPAVVADFIGVWSRVRLVEVVDESPREEDLVRYGLKPPVMKVAVLVAPEAAEDAGIERPALELGSDGKLVPSTYARLDGFPRVVLVTPDARDLEKGVGRRLFGLPSQAPSEPDRQEPARPQMQRIPNR